MVCYWVFVLPPICLNALWAQGSEAEKGCVTNRLWVIHWPVLVEKNRRILYTKCVPRFNYWILANDKLSPSLSPSDFFPTADGPRRGKRPVIRHYAVCNNPSFSFKIWPTNHGSLLTKGIITRLRWYQSRLALSSGWRDCWLLFVGLILISPKDLISSLINKKVRSLFTA